MHYTLRIINQNLSQTEERFNVLLGKSYNVTIKVENASVSDSETQFQYALRTYYGGTLPDDFDKNIVGFVEGDGGMYAFRNYNSVYVVGESGQTVERIYGMYEKQ